MSPATILAPYADRLTRPVGEVAADLESFAALLWKWNSTQNLVSRETPFADIWPRHIADSLQVLPLLRDADRRTLDLGSGGGFPAIPLAVARKGALQSILIEPNARKASFLRTVKRTLELELRVESVRAEDLDATTLPQIDVITARALAPLGGLLALSAPIFGPTTRAIFHKGREYGEEVIEARAAWDFDMVGHPSRTDAQAALLEISNLLRR